MCMNDWEALKLYLLNLRILKCLRELNASTIQAHLGGLKGRID